MSKGIILAFLALAPNAWASDIILKDGSRLEALLLDETETHYHIQMPNGRPMALEKRHVEKIEGEALPWVNAGGPPALDSGPAGTQNQPIVIIKETKTHKPPPRQKTAPPAPKPEDLARDYYAKASRLIQQGKLNEAIKALKQTLALNENHAEAHYFLALLYHQQNNLKEALQASEKSLKMAPEKTQPLYAQIKKEIKTRALIKISAGLIAALVLAAAVFILRLIIKKRRSLHELAVMAQQNLNLKQAIKTLENSMEKKVQEAYAKALINPKNAMEKITAYYGDFRKGQKEHKKLLAQKKCEEAGKMAQAAKWPEAEAAYKEALALQPDFINAHLGLGYVYLSQGQNENALTWYQQAAQLDPHCAAAHYSLGRTYADCRLWPLAILATEKSLQLKPEFPEARQLMEALIGRYVEELTV